MRRGEGYILPCVLVIASAMVFSAVLCYASALGVIAQTKDVMRLSLDRYTASKAPEIYPSVKDGEDIYEELNPDGLAELMTLSGGLERKNGDFYKSDGEGNILYVITTPVLSYSEGGEGELKVRASYTVKVPVYFAGRKIGEAASEVVTESNYIRKY